MENNILPVIHMYCRPNRVIYSGMECYEAFPKDPKSKTLSSAISWSQVKGNDHLKFEVDNKTGFTDVNIVALVERTHGGRAYKAIVSQGGSNFLVDFREDDLLFHIKNGVTSKGVMKSVFSFILSGNLMRLVSKDSPKYSNYLDLHESNTARLKVTKSLMEPNTIYKVGSTPNKYTLYLGKTYRTKVINQFNLQSIKTLVTEVEESDLYWDFDMKDIHELRLGNSVFSKSRKLFTLTKEEKDKDLIMDKNMILARIRSTEGSVLYFKSFFLSSKEELENFTSTYISKLGTPFTRLFVNCETLGKEMNSMYVNLVNKYGIVK